MTPDLKPAERSRPVASERFSDDEMSDIRAGFAKRLREAFDGMSQADIARRCKTTDATIKIYMDGDRLPIAEMLLQIHRVTGINIQWLLTGKGPRRVERVNEMFTEEEEGEIRELAANAGRTFENQVRVMTMAAIEFKQKI